MATNVVSSHVGGNMYRSIFTIACSSLFAISMPSIAHQAQASGTSDHVTPKTTAALNTMSQDAKKEVAWDEFNHRGTMMWACRNIYTGNIVNPSLCTDQPKEDKVWPDKQVPADYRGGGIADSMAWPPRRPVTPASGR